MLFVRIPNSYVPNSLVLTSYANCIRLISELLTCSIVPNSSVTKEKFPPLEWRWLVLGRGRLLNC